MSKQTPSWPGARAAGARTTLARLLRTTRPHSDGLTGTGLALRPRSNRSARVPAFCILLAHENDAAALPIHSWGCLPRHPSGDGGDAPRRR